MTIAPARPLVAIITLPAEIDIANHGDVCRALTQPLDDGAMLVIADMGEVTFCGADGVRAITTAARRAHDRGALIRLAGLTPPARRVFGLMDAWDTPGLSAPGHGTTAYALPWDGGTAAPAASLTPWTLSSPCGKP